MKHKDNVATTKAVDLALSLASEPVSVVEDESAIEVREIKALNSLADIKLAVKQLSASDKLALFNWLKSASNGSGKATATKNLGVGDFVREKIFEGYTNNEIVKLCEEKYGNSQTTYNCVVWYRNKLKKEKMID